MDHRCRTCQGERGLKPTATEEHEARSGQHGTRESMVNAPAEHVESRSAGVLVHHDERPPG
jgi:hypothetical protein